MVTDRTGAGITGTDTMDGARTGVDIAGTGVIGPGLTDADITGNALAGLSTTCAVTGPAAITGPGITIRPTCTLLMFTCLMFTCLASTCTSCFLCTDGRASSEPFGGWFFGSFITAPLCRLERHAKLDPGSNPP